MSVSQAAGRELTQEEKLQLRKEENKQKRKKWSSQIVLALLLENSRVVSKVTNLNMNLNFVLPKLFNVRGRIAYICIIK